MDILCSITDWDTHTVKVGKAKGNTVSTRLVITYDNWCWQIAKQQYEKEPMGQKFHGGFKNLLTCLEKDYGFGINVIQDLIPKIIEALSENIKVNDKEKQKIAHADISDLHEVGRMIDDTFDVEYRRRSDVRKRVNGGQTDDERE